MHGKLHHALDDWDNVRLLLACLESESLSVAARQLGVQQSTVSRRLQALEDSLDATLFIRTPEGILPTELAERLRTSVDAIGQHVRELEMIAAGALPSPSGRVDLAITESMAVHYILPRVDALTARHPEIELNLVTGYGVTDLTRREADISLRFIRPTRGDLVVKRIAVIQSVVVAHKRYIESYGAPTLDTGRWLCLDIPGISTPEQTWFTRHVSASPWLRTTSYTALIQGVLMGVGVGVIPAPIVANSDEDLVLIETGSPSPEALELWLTTHRAIRHTPRVDAVWQWLVELGEAELSTM